MKHWPSYDLLHSRVEPKNDREPTETASVLFRLIDLVLAKLSKALNVNCRDGVISVDGVGNGETEQGEGVCQGLN